MAAEEVTLTKFSHFFQKHRLARLQASYTLTSAMCAYSSRKAGIERDLSSYGLVANSVKSICTDLMQEAAQSLVQLVERKSVELGQVIARIISMEMVIDLGIKRFRKDLIDNCLGVLIHDIAGLMGHFRVPDNSLFIEDYQEGSSWMNFQ